MMTRKIVDKYEEMVQHCTTRIDELEKLMNKHAGNLKKEAREARQKETRLRSVYLEFLDDLIDEK